MNGLYIGNTLNHAAVSRDEFIGLYYHAGYTINEIIGFLASRHNIAVSHSTVHRSLRRMNLYRRNNESSLENTVVAIQGELAGTGRNIGYRAMRRRLLTDHGVNASAETVRVALQVLDSDGVNARARHALRRRVYFSKGPNFSVHIDGWDKLKPYGISVHAAVDGYSRRILWLHACSSNKKPEFIAQYYIDYVREINGLPCIIYADRGTENAIVRDLQLTLRWDHGDAFQGVSSFRYGPSTRNTRIERFWRDLRAMCGQFWMDAFKGMADHGILDTTDNIHFECIRYCFMALVNSDLQNTIRHWNEHRIRRGTNTEGPFGKPDVLYFQPNVFGTRDYQMPLPGNIDEVERRYCQRPAVNGVSDEFNTLADAIILQHALQYPPNTKDEALDLFCRMIIAIEAIN